MRTLRSLLIAGAMSAACATFTYAQAPTPKVAEKDARATALARVPNGVVKSEELGKAKGRLVYSYDISVPGKTGVQEVAVDANSGKVLSVKHETPKQEAKEAKAEAKEMKAAPKPAANAKAKAPAKKQ